MVTRRQIVFASFVLLLGGCVTSPVPPGYTGPTAKVLDSSEMDSQHRAAYYFASEVNGKRIQTNLDAFREANRGKGFSISAGTLSRLVPAGTAKLKLEAQNAYGAPIQEIVMAATMRSATSLIEVDLKPDEIYQVRGVLAEGKDEVWLEIRGTGERVGKKIAQ